MKKSKFTVREIVAIVRWWEDGKDVTEICRTYGIGQPTLYVWRSKYSGLSIKQARRMRDLAAEKSHAYPNTPVKDKTTG